MALHLVLLLREAGQLIAFEPSRSDTWPLSRLNHDDYYGRNLSTNMGRSLKLHLVREKDGEHFTIDLKHVLQERTKEAAKISNCIISTLPHGSEYNHKERARQFAHI